MKTLLLAAAFGLANALPLTQMFLREAKLPTLGRASPAAAAAAICDDVEQFRGYFTLRTGPGSKNYFYWHFASRQAPESAPVVLWLTGGPGCSSEVALFGENGPCKVNAAGTGTVKNDFSWNEHANLIYVDQPTGTGFSYGTGFDHNEKGVANDMYDTQTHTDAHTHTRTHTLTHSHSNSLPSSYDFSNLFQ
jgi:cathepsin A (carboxypeptidase C)